MSNFYGDVCYVDIFCEYFLGHTKYFGTVFKHKFNEMYAKNFVWSAELFCVQNCLFTLGYYDDLNELEKLFLRDLV